MSALKQNYSLQKQMPASKKTEASIQKRGFQHSKRQMPASIQKRRMPASKETDAHIQRRRILASKEDGCHHVLTTGIQASRRLTLMDEHQLFLMGWQHQKERYIKISIYIRCQHPNVGKLTCSVNWKHQDQKCYKLDQENRNFTESKQICENLNAEMIMPKTKKKTKYCRHENIVLTEYKEKEEYSKPNPSVNVYIALFTTAHARLKIIRIIRYSTRKSLYMDTDSCIYNDDGSEACKK
ncbi:unnamed protein product [Mytilus coruscus]|uniref:DNA-directed DNA polymerase n=1 Tax=Mytilus coruscus TaxID=42192 RepID=A0A6J7ZW60_MYTCO|nr:unnamed protein product [Mytilus coruscus]